MSDKPGFNPHGTTILGLRRNGALGGVLTNDMLVEFLDDLAGR